MKKPDRKWMAVLVVLAGMAWGAALASQHAPQPDAPRYKNLIPGG
jgi:hypothetical protein